MNSFVTLAIAFCISITTSNGQLLLFVRRGDEAPLPVELNTEATIAELKREIELKDDETLMFKDAELNQATALLSDIGVGMEAVLEIKNAREVELIFKEVTCTGVPLNYTGNEVPIRVPLNTDITDIIETFPIGDSARCVYRASLQLFASQNGLPPENPDDVYRRSENHITDLLFRVKILLLPLRHGIYEPSFSTRTYVQRDFQYNKRSAGSFVPQDGRQAALYMRNDYSRPCSRTCRMALIPRGFQIVIGPYFKAE